jgi:hypothetical protein
MELPCPAPEPLLFAARAVAGTNATAAQAAITRLRPACFMGIRGEQMVSACDNGGK